MENKVISIRSSENFNSVEEGNADRLIQGFVDFFSDLSEESVREKIDSVYSEDAYLNDTLKVHRGIDAIRDYFVMTARAVKSCRVHIEDLAVSDNNYYIRWTMDVQFQKLNRGQVCRSIGMSHLKFNSDGLVCFHQDYWDSSSGFFEYFPGIGYLLKAVKKRL